MSTVAERYVRTPPALRTHEPVLDDAMSYIRTALLVTALGGLFTAVGVWVTTGVPLAGVMAALLFVAGGCASCDEACRRALRLRQQVTPLSQPRSAIGGTLVPIGPDTTMAIAEVIHRGLFRDLSGTTLAKEVPELRTQIIDTATELQAAARRGWGNV